MKQILVIASMMLVITSCEKQASNQLAPNTNLIEVDDFKPNGEFNKVKRSPNYGEIMSRNSNGNVHGKDSDKDGVLDKSDNCPNTYNPNQADSDKDGIGDACETISPPPPPPPPTEGKDTVIFLDFDGYTNTSIRWSVSTVAPANMTDVEQDSVIARVKRIYNPFNVTVTKDEAVYNNADHKRRIRVVITESWEWYGQAGGVAYRGSFVWGDNTPCFVFSSLLQYNYKYVGEACSHEAGHTLGLQHQAVCENGVITSSYYGGKWYGDIYRAPVMGASYAVSYDGEWWIGPTPSGCFDIQNDIQKLQVYLTLRTQ